METEQRTAPAASSPRAIIIESMRDARGRWVHAVVSLIDGHRETDFVDADRDRARTVAQAYADDLEISRIVDRSRDEPTPEEERVLEAARWLATTPTEDRPHPTIPVIGRRYGLTPKQAIAAIREASLMNARTL